MSGVIARGLLISFFLLAITSLLCYPLFLKGFIAGHDSSFHLLWAQQFVRSMHMGIRFPQWVPDANYGCGNASFIFYPPFTFYTYAMASLFTNNVLMMLSVSSFLAILASGAAMYLFCRTYLGRPGSLVGSIAYMGAPYHLADLYVRAALAELWAFAWIPTICFFLIKIRESRPGYSFGLAVSYAGLLLTHLPTALLFSPFLFSYILLLLWEEKAARLFLRRIFILGLGTGLSSVYLIPVMLEQKYVNIHALTSAEFQRLSSNFLFSGQMLSAPFGELLSHIAISTSLFAVAALLFLLFKREVFGHRLFFQGIFFAASALFSLFMMFPFSEPLWNATFFFSTVQFPWRLLLLTSYYSCLELGFIFEKLFAGKKTNRWITTFTGLVTIALIASNVFYSEKVMRSFKPFPFDFNGPMGKKGLTIQPDTQYDDLMKDYNLFFTGNLWLMDVLEYRPIWSVIKPSQRTASARSDLQALADFRAVIQNKIKASPSADFSAERIAYAEERGSYLLFPPLNILRAIGKAEGAMLLPRELWNEKSMIKEGNGTVRVTQWEPENRIVHFRSSTPETIIIKTFYYPRWKAFIKDQDIHIAPDPSTGLILIKMPQGEYDIRLSFQRGIYRSIGITVSIISLAIIFMLPRWPTLRNCQPFRLALSDHNN